MKRPFDIRNILSSPLIYSFFQNLVGQKHARDVYVNEYIRPQKGDRILDIGCGPADILDHLPKDIEYFGVDISQGYIDAARKRYGKRGTFICRELNTNIISEMVLFDIVTAIGVIHHLDDDDAKVLIEIAFNALKSGGRLVTIDPVYVEGQSKLDRYLVSKDRGEFVRTQEKHLEIVFTQFRGIKIDLHKKLLYIPYALLILECQKI